MPGTAPRGPVEEGTCSCACPLPQGRAGVTQVYVGQRVPAPEGHGSEGLAQVGGTCLTTPAAHASRT